MNADPWTVPTTREVLAAAWRVTRPNLFTITAITLMVYIPIDVLLSFIPVSEEEGLLGLKLYFKVQRVLEFWIGTVVSLALVHVADAASRGARVSVSDAFRRASERYGSGLWSTFLYELGLLVGLVLLVVPGIAAAVFWVFYLQFVVIHDKPGKPALVESYRFVKGRWWRFLKPMLLLGCLFVAVALVAAVTAAFMPESRAVEVLMGIPGRLGSSFLVVCLTQLYLLSGGRRGQTQEPAGDLEDLRPPTQAGAWNPNAT
jgi:hypothetical protein